jgi:hypothetical protein
MTFCLKGYVFIKGVSKGERKTKTHSHKLKYTVELDHNPSSITLIPDDFTKFWEEARQIIRTYRIAEGASLEINICDTGDLFDRTILLDPRTLRFRCRLPIDFLNPTLY